MAIMTERARALREMGAILEKESQQVLLTELHDLLSILSEDPPGEMVTWVVGKTDPITLLFIR